MNCNLQEDIEGSCIAQAENARTDYGDDLA
jgi:hypothetical protein